MFKFVIALVFIAQSRLVLCLEENNNIKSYADFTNDVYYSINKQITSDALDEGIKSPALDKILYVIKQELNNLDWFTGVDVFVKLNYWLSSAFYHLNLNRDEDTRSNVAKINQYVKKADAAFERFEKYSRDRSIFEDENKAQKFIDEVTSLPDQLDKMFALSKNVLSAAAEYLQDQNATLTCNSGMSAQAHLYQFGTIFSILEVRSYLLASFGYAAYSLIKKTNVTNEIDLIRKDVNKRTNNYLSETLQLSKDLPRNVELCDRKEYLEGEDYVMLKNFLDFDIQGRCIPLTAVTTNRENNFVVTGIQWKMQNGVLQILLEEGRLIDQARIRQYTERLVPLLDYEMRGIDLYDYQNRRYLDAFKDYIILDVVTIMNIDDIMLPKGYVLTGVRTNYKENKLSLEIQGTKFDFASGKLILDDEDSTIWQSAESMSKDLPDRPEQYNNPRTPFEQLPRPYSSEKAPSNEVDSEPNSQYIFYFAKPNEEEEAPIGEPDVVPFFDIRLVHTSPNAATGVGLFHRGHEGYGGYFNFRVFNLNMSQYMDSNEGGGNDYN